MHNIWIRRVAHMCVLIYDLHFLYRYRLHCKTILSHLTRFKYIYEYKFHFYVLFFFLKCFAILIINDHTYEPLNDRALRDDALTWEPELCIVYSYLKQLLCLSEQIKDKSLQKHGGSFMSPHHCL